MFLIPSVTDSNLKLYHISSAHNFLLIFLKLYQVAFLSFCGNQEKWELRLSKWGKKAHEYSSMLKFIFVHNQVSSG